MIEEIMPDLYRIEVPLPKNPLKAVNSYVLKGPDRNLIVDTAMNREECERVLAAGLRELDVEMAETDIFVTHLHADHLGLAVRLASETSKVYFNKPDADVMSMPQIWQYMLEIACRHGFPEDRLQQALKQHPGHRFGPDRQAEYTLVADGDRLGVGAYRFTCVQTPGHTPGHTCLYESEAKILLAGDHILADITPNISLWIDIGDPLAAYLNSLDKVYELDVEMVLPGHRRIFTDCRGRIKELKLHHENRVDEVLDIVKKGPQTAYGIAGRMTWDMTYESWEKFPVVQQWFATGEALAHLKYLEDKGTVVRETLDQRVAFSLK